MSNVRVEPYPRRQPLMADQSDAESAGLFSRRTNQTHEAQVYARPPPPEECSPCAALGIPPFPSLRG
eukprot:2601785-Pyramimonas_sp.AAC.1